MYMAIFSASRVSAAVGSVMALFFFFFSPDQEAGGGGFTGGGASALGAAAALLMLLWLYRAVCCCAKILANGTSSSSSLLSSGIAIVTLPAPHEQEDASEWTHCELQEIRSLLFTLRRPPLLYPTLSLYLYTVRLQHHIGPHRPSPEVVPRAIHSGPLGQNDVIAR